MIDAGCRVVGLLLVPADWHEYTTWSDTTVYPGAGLDLTILRLNNYFVAILNIMTLRLVGVNLAKQFGPHFLGLPEVMRPGMKVWRRWSTGYQFGVKHIWLTIL